MLWAKNEQVCATCAMWTGKRKQTFSFVEDEEPQGKCIVDGTRITGAQCSCQVWYGLPLEFPLKVRQNQEPVSVS